MSQKFLLIDLDGTLINTTELSFKSMKDGIDETDLSVIIPITGVFDFLTECIKREYQLFIVSDSHPRYVDKIYGHFFKQFCSDYITLADKPNTGKVSQLIQKNNLELIYEPNPSAFVIGDTWLDIEMGRGLGIPTIFTQLYTSQHTEIRDGIGVYMKNIKSGPTYSAISYSNIIEILDKPIENLLCLEAAFQGVESQKTIEIYPTIEPVTVRYNALARQSCGECDKFSLTEQYFEFSRDSRTLEFLETIASGVVNYIKAIKGTLSTSRCKFTYIPDKQTTIPIDKMRRLFDIISEKYRIPFEQIFAWNPSVTSSTRTLSNTEQRVDFVSQSLHLLSEVTSHDIVVFDDQFTSGGTTKAVCTMLKRAGANQVIFTSLFQMCSVVESNKLCPRCQKNMQTKIRRDDGRKFYSCVLPQFGGSGCGYTESIFDESSKECPRCDRKLEIRVRREDGCRFYSCVPPQFGGNGCGYTESIVLK